MQENRQNSQTNHTWIRRISWITYCDRLNPGMEVAVYERLTVKKSQMDKSADRVAWWPIDNRSFHVRTPFREQPERMRFPPSFLLFSWVVSTIEKLLHEWVGSFANEADQTNKHRTFQVCSVFSRMEMTYANLATSFCNPKVVGVAVVTVVTNVMTIPLCTQYTDIQTIEAFWCIN